MIAPNMLIDVRYVSGRGRLRGDTLDSQPPVIAEALGVFQEPNKELPHTPFLIVTISRHGIRVHVLVEDTSHATPPVSVSDRSHDPSQACPMIRTRGSVSA